MVHAMYHMCRTRKHTIESALFYIIFAHPWISLCYVYVIYNVSVDVILATPVWHMVWYRRLHKKRINLDVRPFRAMRQCDETTLLGARARTHARKSCCVRECVCVWFNWYGHVAAFGETKNARRQRRVYYDMLDSIECWLGTRSFTYVYGHICTCSYIRSLPDLLLRNFNSQELNVASEIV